MNPAFQKAGIKKAQAEGRVGERKGMKGNQGGQFNQGEKGEEKQKT